MEKWYFQSTHPNRDLAAKDIVGNSVFCPFMSAYNTGTFCSCHYFWQEIHCLAFLMKILQQKCLFDMCEFWALFCTSEWELILSLGGLCILAQDGRLAMNTKSSEITMGLRFYWFETTLLQLWWIHSFPSLIPILCNRYANQVVVWTRSSMFFLASNCCLRLNSSFMGLPQPQSVYFFQCWR